MGQTFTEFCKEKGITQADLDKITEYLQTLTTKEDGEMIRNEVVSIDVGPVDERGLCQLNIRHESGQVVSFRTNKEALDKAMTTKDELIRRGAKIVE